MLSSVPGTEDTAVTHQSAFLNFSVWQDDVTVLTQSLLLL